jgi:hypothetical protein
LSTSRSPLYSAGHVQLPIRVLLLCSPCASRQQVPCSTSRVVLGAHRVVGPGTHRGSGPREVHTTVVALRWMRNGPRSSFYGFRPPLARQRWFPSGSYRGGFHGDNFDGCDDLVCAKLTLDQMARRRCHSFETNPNAESFVHSRARF